MIPGPVGNGRGMAFNQTRARLLIGAMAFGAFLVVVGLFTSAALVVVGAALVAFVPLAYAVVELERNRPPAPEQRYDSLGDDLERLMDRIGPPEERPRRPRRRRSVSADRGR